jgi:hypothetical protein
MTAPLAPGPKAYPNTSLSDEDFQARIAIDKAQLVGRRTRNGISYAAPGIAIRITIREVWKLVHELKNTIKHEQNVLGEQK